MIYNTSKFGHDISTWQDAPNIAGSVDFQKMRNNGASFVILRSSVGNLKDEDFETYKINSRGILPRAIYHYYWNNISPVEQANAILNALGSERIEGRIWIDLETTSAGAYSRPSNWRALMQILEAKGYRTGVYTGKYWWDDHAVKTGEDLSYFYERPLWEAWYINDPAYVIVAGKWLRMMLWQDTSLYNGQAAGVESTAIDRNWWNDDYSFFAEWGAIPQPPTGETPMLYGKVNTAVLNIRNAGSASGIDIGDLQQNDYIVAARSVGGWWELKEAYRGSWTGAPVLLANGTPVNNSVSPMWAKDSYIVVVPAPVVPPSARTVTSIDIALAAGSVVKRTYSDGTTESETA